MWLRDTMVASVEPNTSAAGSSTPKLAPVSVTSVFPEDGPVLGLLLAMVGPS